MKSKKQWLDGRDKIEKRELRLFTTIEVAKAFSNVLDRTEKEIEFVLLNDSVPLIEKLVASCLLRDLKKGRDLSNLFRILERIIGPVPIITRSDVSSDMSLVYGHRDPKSNG